MATKYTKMLPLSLPGDEYDAFARIAQAEERDPIQQARWLIRQAVRRNERGDAVGKAVRQDSAIDTQPDGPHDGHAV